ncbi:MAG: hypothetical protein LBM59_07715 [Ruminococcus sp.]|jgi:hypothetical protein|nr:hypothetical protein [Ruminococcus sp.]
MEKEAQKPAVSEEELENLTVSGGAVKFNKYVMGYEAEKCSYYETDIERNYKQCDRCKKVKRTSSSLYCTCAEAWN